MSISNFSLFLAQAELYNEATANYVSSDLGQAEQGSRKQLKKVFQQCMAECPEILTAVEASPEFCASLKKRVRNEWVSKIEKGMESRPEVDKRNISLEEFMQKALGYNSILVKAEETPEYIRWRSLIDSYADAVFDQKSSGVSVEELLKVLKENGLEEGPAAGKLGYWEKKFF